MKAKYAKGFRFPGWLFLILMSLYVETLLHIWTAGTIVPGRMATVLVFGLAFGCLFSVPGSFLKIKGEKILAVVLGAVLGVLGLLQFFIHDAYGVFMPMISVFATAEGVATGYGDIIASLLLKNIWRICLVMGPVVLFAIFSRGKRHSWKQGAALILCAAAFFGAGIGLVHWIGLDTAQFSSAANFDGTVKSFGLSMGLTLDLTGGAVVGQGGVEFEIPEVTEPAQTEAPTTAPQQEGTEPQETAEPTEPPVVYEAHAYDLDFIALAEAENSSEIASIHRYIASLTPAMENEYTGLFEGKNLILITAEAFSSHVIDPELTPALYRMATEGIQFTDYYHQLWGCGTTGGEFANLLGIVPYGGTTTMQEVVEQDMFLTMGRQLQKQGYVSGAFHNNDHTYYQRHETHTKLGYDRFFAWGNGMEELISPGWTRSDEEMFQVTLPDYLNQDTPFSLYYMTVSGHSPYAVDSNTMSKKNYDLVKDLPYSEFVKGYLACSMDLELAMAYTIAALEEAGIADDTVIVISTDHYPYGLAPSDTWGGYDYMAELYGKNWSNDRTRDSNTLIIWSGCLEDMDIVVDDPVSALDILPTLSNLFGLEYDSRLLVGRDVFSDTDPLVFWPLTYSWKTDKGFYDAKTGEFEPAEGVEVTQEYIDSISAIVRNKTVYSRSVQYYNYFNDISRILNSQE